jgi:hypothetical protein
MRLPDFLRNKRSKESAAYIIAMVLCLWILERLLKLRHSDLSVPFVYNDSDGTFFNVMVKTVITNGWYLNNDSLGMPKGMEMHDFPIPDSFHFLVFKFLGLFTSNSGLIINLFFLLTFPLTTVSSLFVLRRFGISYAPAILASLLYTFTFYHFFRNVQHLMYSPYYNVPLVVMMALWIFWGELSLTKTEENRTRWNLRDPKLICSVLICLLTASTGGAYYFFFASVLLLSAGIFIAIRDKSLRRMLLPSILIAIMFGTFIINISPNLIYFYKNGQSPVAVRNPAEAEYCGLKVGLLLTPTLNHRLKSLAEFKDVYGKTPLVNENVDSSLGFIGSIGFLTLIGFMLFHRPFPSREGVNRVSELLSHLGIMNITAVLVATIGGFGSLFNHLVSPQIRCYNRFSIFIAFLSLFAAAILLDLVYLRYIKTRLRQVLFHISIVLLILLGVLDQTPKNLLPDFKTVKAEYQNDSNFIRQIESALPPRAMIFQLPLCTYPEGESYNQLKPYLHSNTLRWSFGAIRNRPAGLWQKAIAAKPTNEMVEALAIAGFSGIYIDRALYKDNGAGIENELSKFLVMEPLVSSTKQYSFFNLIDYKSRLEENLGDDLAIRSERLLHPLDFSWLKGCYWPEETSDKIWRWCINNVELQIENSLSHARQVNLEMSIYVPNEGNFKIESQILNESLRIRSSTIPIKKNFSIPPGKHILKFTCDAPAVDAPLDERRLVFRINDFKLTEAE